MEAEEGRLPCRLSDTFGTILVAKELRLSLQILVRRIEREIKWESG